MSISFPRNDLFSVDFQDAKFWMAEQQEYSRSADATTYGKSLGEAIWKASFVTEDFPIDDALAYEAKLQSLDGVIHRFYAHDVRRPYPRAHADGNFTDSGKIHSTNVNNIAMRLKTLPAGFVLSIGDYLAFDYGSTPSRALHRVMETVTADGDGLTPEFEVRPHIRPGAAVDAAVILKKPSALFALEPGSVDPKWSGTAHQALTFAASQVIE